MVRRRQRALASAVECLEPRQLLAVHFSVDLQQGVKAISPYIYGINSSLSGALSHLTLERSGGNRLTAYNWENNASNAGSDWQYQNDGLMSASNTPGAAMKSVLDNAVAHNAAALLTVPMAGYVSADKNGGGDVRNSGANYLSTRFKVSLPTKGSAFTLTPNQNDAYVYQDEFVNWVKTNYANSTVLYDLDNEPDLWNSTHAEIHPTAVTYAELVQKTKDYAKAIKWVNANAAILGPVNYGWQGMVNLQNASDAAGRDFLSYYLSQMKAAQTSDPGNPNQVRLLDALDVHWYPEATGGGVRITGTDTSAAVVAARLQAPRSLWDPTYTETSWITQWSTNGPINLIPRLQSKIDANYPGTKIAISEYNYGAGGDISGGIAVADALGIFGRMGVFEASEWPMSSSEPFVAGALNMYRNYDGANSTFGNMSVQATTDDVAGSSIYASYPTQIFGVTEVALVAINKTASAMPAVMKLNGVTAGSTAQIYQLTSASSTPQAAGSATVTDPTAFNYTMPAYSVSTIRIVLAVSNAPGTPAGFTATPGAGKVTLTWNASSGATSYSLYRSTTPGGEGSAAYKTGLTGTSYTDTSVTNGQPYYYQITAVNGSGESTKSAEKSATPQGTQSVPPHAIASGRAVDMAYDSSGRLYAAYYDASSQTLKYTGRSAGGTWSASTTIDSATAAGQYLSLGINSSGLVAVAYYDAYNADLKYAQYNGSGWDRITVDSAGRVGLYPSINFDASGKPVVSYYDKSHGDLKLAAWDGSKWVASTVDSAGDTGRYSSLATNPSTGRWAISYENETGGLFRLAEQGKSGWAFTTVDDTLGGGGYTSLAFSSTNQLGLSYYDSYNANLKYATRSTSGTWTVGTVASAGSVGMYNQLHFGSSGNTAQITFYNKTGDSVLNCAGTTPAVWGTVPLVSGGGRELSVAYSSSGKRTLAWFDTVSVGLMVQDV